MAEGYKDWSAGDILTAADLEDYTVKQSVMVFADASARTSALSSVLREGMVSYLKDTDSTEVYDGSAWAAVGGGDWTAYTPTTSGLTIGNGTLTGRYTEVNGLVFFNVSFVMGSTSAVTGGVTFGLPVTRVTTGTGGATGFYANTGTTYQIPAITDMGATSVSLRVMNTSSTYLGVSLISAAVPFTWATTDTMSVAGFYEAA